MLTNLGCLGAMPANLARLLGLPAAQNAGPACRFEKAESAAWPHLGRERGDAHLIEDALLRVRR